MGIARGVTSRGGSDCLFLSNLLFKLTYAACYRSPWRRWSRSCGK